MGLEDLPIDEIVEKLNDVKGITRIFDRRGSTLKLSLAMPYGARDMIAVLNLSDEESYLDVARTPEVTPPAYLRINEILASYELQPVWESRGGCKVKLSI